MADSRNASLLIPTSCEPSAKVTVVNDALLRKEFSPIEVTAAGISTEVNPLPLKASPPIKVTPKGMVAAPAQVLPLPTTRLVTVKVPPVPQA
jgi:hypothetical protein